MENSFLIEFMACPGSKNLPLIQSYDNLQAMNRSIGKSEREHDLVIAVSLLKYIFLIFGRLISNYFVFGSTTLSLQ